MTTQLLGIFELASFVIKVQLWKNMNAIFKVVEREGPSKLLPRRGHFSYALDTKYDDFQK